MSGNVYKIVYKELEHLCYNLAWDKSVEFVVCILTVYICKKAVWITTVLLLLLFFMLELSKPQPPEELMDLLVLLYEFQNPRLTAEVLASIKTMRLNNIRMTSLKCFILSYVLLSTPAR